MKVIFIGNKYYYESGTRMSSVYQVDETSAFAFERTDWGLIQIALKRGEEVHIRPATKEELERMDKHLEKLIREREKNK